MERQDTTDYRKFNQDENQPQQREEVKREKKAYREISNNY
jgi:hypothetical protein